MSAPLMRNFQLSFLACGCNSRCFHCSFANNPEAVEPLPLDDLRRCVAAAEGMALRVPPLYERLNVMWGAEPADYPQLAELVALGVERGWRTVRTLATNAERLAREHELLPRLRDAGLETVQLSFYASGHDHDALEGRTGAWDDKLAVGPRALDAGLDVVSRLFLRAGHGSELAPIIQALEEACDGRVRHTVDVWMPAGRGEHLDRWVPTEEDFEALPASVRGLPRLDEYRSEARWVELARDGAMAEMLRAFALDREERGNPDALLNLSRDTVPRAQALLDELHAEGLASGRVSRAEELGGAPVAAWAELVGRPGSNRMYSVISMRQEWQRRASRA